MINNNKYLGAALATLAVAGLVAAPQASAKTKKAAAPVATVSKTEVLEAQLRAMQDEIAALRAQVNASAPSATVAATVAADSKKVQELDDWAASVKAKHAETHSKGKDDNLIFFRGGFARNDSKRNDILTGAQIANNTLGGGPTNQDGYYIGAGLDFGLTDNVWGLLDKTDVDAELMFDYRSFGQKNLPANPLAVLVNNVSPGAQGTSNVNSVSVSQFTLAASPKIKFMKGSAFRPWLIPFGLTVNVISPPSNGVTVLNPGMQFGTGAEYAIWKAIKVGADVRYNLTGRAVDGVNTDGLTAGGYLGIGF